MEREQMNYMDEIVTVVEPLPKFWQAEDYHQDYFQNNPQKNFSKKVVKTKVDKARELPTF